MLARAIPRLRQFFDTASSTYTYLLFSKNEAVIIDPVRENTGRYLKLIQELGLKLVTILDTHVHADHITAAAKIRQSTPNSTYKISQHAEIRHNLAHSIKEGDTIPFGDSFLQVVETPGHTRTCITYITPDNQMAFTGDALFVRGCGRTDFQGGSSEDLYNSIHNKLYKMLPDDCLVYPGHDYNGFTCTTIGEEKKYNPRLAEHVTLEQFKRIMENLNLPRPTKIDEALPANLLAGGSA